MDNSLFFMEFNVTASCLCRTGLLSSGLQPQQHYSSVPAKQYDRYKGEERERPAAQLRVDKVEITNVSITSFQKGPLVIQFDTPR